MCRSTDATVHTVLMLSVAEPFSGGGGDFAFCIIAFLLNRFRPSVRRTEASSGFLTSSTRRSTAVTHARRACDDKSHRVDRSTVTQRGFPRAQSLLSIWWSHVPCFARYWVSSHERRDFHARSSSPCKLPPCVMVSASRNCRPVASARCNSPKDAFA